MESFTGWDGETSPFHSGECELQARVGREEHLDKAGRAAFRSYMPNEHREFFSRLPFMVIGSVDSEGRPWASMIFGEPGFVTSPSDRRLEFHNSPVPGDPLADNLDGEAPIGLLGIELPTRRRNRMNGLAEKLNNGSFAVNVVQSFGNCPQYIQTRSPRFARDPGKPFKTRKENFETLDESAVALIVKSDTFFVASHNDRDDKHDTGGIDVSHRGGQPGFVKVEGNTLTIPDFVGNFFFNTLGNFMINPRAGLIFVDFETGDLVLLTGTVEILWDPTPEIEAFKGAERAWRFTLKSGVRIRGGSPLRWSFGEASPTSNQTGDWDDAAKRLAAEKLRKSWLPYRVARVINESEAMKSFYLESHKDNALFAHLPGQYLTVRVAPEGTDAPLVRTYTLSSAPSDPLYRLSIKREGATSSYLHENIRPGDTIEARAPSGSFVLDTREKRPAVLIGAGIGITPLISMAREVVADGQKRRQIRPLTIIHVTRNLAQRPFAGAFGRLVLESGGKVRYFSLLTQPEAEAREGVNFHIRGRLTRRNLQRILPIADYDFFICGPSAFMQSTYDMLRELGIQDARLFAETFGPSSLKRRADPGLVEATSGHIDEADSALVTFTRTGFEQPWSPDEGTLLDFAEKHGLSPPFGCRSGRCGSCAARLIAGKIVYREQPQFDTDEDSVLLCCSVPAAGSDTVELKI